MVGRLALTAALLTFALAGLTGCGGSDGVKRTESQTSPSTTAPSYTISMYEGKLLTIQQVRDAFAGKGFPLRPFVKGQPSLGYRAANLPDESYVWVGIATSSNQSAPSFAYLVGVTAKPKHLVVKNVGIDYHVSPSVLRRLAAVVSTLKQEARG